jgi:hypothetical protein
MTQIPAQDYELSAYHSLLFRVAFARPRYCLGCICFTPDERAYQRRVFKLARAWSKQLGGTSRTKSKSMDAQ